VYRWYFILLVSMENPDVPPLLPPPVIHTPAPGEPESVVPETYITRRNMAGWISLAMIFAFLLSLNFMDIHASKVNTDPSVHPYGEQETQIRQAMSQRNLFDQLKSHNPDVANAAARTLDDTEKTLSKKATTDPAAGRLLVVAKTELSQPLSNKDVESAAKPINPANNAFAAIYEAKELSRGQAATLAQALPDTEWAYKAAKAHAFELAGDKRVRNELAPSWKFVALEVFALFAVGLCFAGVIVWILYFNRRKMGLSQPLGHPATPMSPSEADRFAIRGAMLLGAFVFGQVVGGIAFMHSSKAAMFAGITALSLMSVLAVCTLPAGDMRISFRRIGLRSDKIGKDILWGLAGYAALAPILVVTMAIGLQLMKVFGQSTHPAAELLESSPTLSVALALLFAASIGAPIMEEIIFRGTLFPAIGTLLKSPIWGIVISSFLFAALHPQGVPLWLALASVGAMNCLLAYQTKSLIPSMVLHFTHNTVIVILGLLLS